MFFKTQSRINPATGKQSIYYRLVENYRNALGEVRQRNLLSVGFMEDVTSDELWAIAKGLNDRYAGEMSLFAENEKTQGYIDLYWKRLVDEKKLDVVREIREKESKKDWQTIDMQSIGSKNVRELGSEWLSLQSLQRLGLDTFLQRNGFNEEEVSLSLSHIVSKAIYPVSELKTVSFMQENSSICELTGLDYNGITKDKLYDISLKLYKLKDALENYLSHKTNELFDLEDKIILYDLTNTYFEGEKRSSQKARYGRSKEKRSDCKLLVLALVVNVEGFIKYSSIYEGNRADSTTLGDMIEKLRLATSKNTGKAIVVIDAGIATEENLSLIKSKGYDYVCVSRSNLKKYVAVPNKSSVSVMDNKNRLIELLEVQTQDHDETEYYLKVESPGKKLKEASMHTKFTGRFEESLQAIATSITRKHGTKRYDKVNQRIGRLKEKYASTHRLYEITLKKDENDICQSMEWKRIESVQTTVEKSHGVYFIRSSITDKNETLVWKIYNCIREIESSIRCLKSDLNLRPVYHKTDEAAEAHLHMGILAYWIVNSIRHPLKKKGIHSDWREIVRLMNTQKCVTTTMENNKGECIWVRTCSEPTEKVRLIYRALEMKEAPFVRKKSVVLKNELKKNDKTVGQNDTS